MGSFFGGLLAEKGLDVTLVDVWEDHVKAIQENGLKISGKGGERTIKINITSDPSSLAPVDIVFVQCKAALTKDALLNAKPMFHKVLVIYFHLKNYWANFCF